MTQLSPQTITKIHTYIDEGVPLEDLFSGNAGRANIERVKVAEQVYERFCQDPMLDINRCLRRTYGRTKQQMMLDKQVVEIFVESLEGISKKMWEQRITKLAEREVRISEQTGDWKPLDRAISHMEKIVAMKEDEEEDHNQFKLPRLFVRVDVLDPTKTYYDENDTQKLTDKYGGHVDPLMQMVNEKAAALVAMNKAQEEKEEKQMPLDYEE